MKQANALAGSRFSAIPAALAGLRDFTGYCLRRFVADGCATAAGALSYTSLVSLVPVTAIALAVLSAFPIFADMRDQLLARLFANFVPEVGAEVEYWFRYFAGTSVRTTTIGILALAVTVILLLATIEDQLHNIWHVRSRRPWLQRILAYWAILTLGPLLLGTSFSLPRYLDLLAANTGINPWSMIDGPWFQAGLRLLPFLLEAIALALVFALIPNCAVRWREAILGAVVSALLLEGLKYGFTVYVARFSSYRAVYGALAAIPIFLLWMYVAWAAVLFGAVVAAALPRWRIDEGSVTAANAAERLGLSLALLAELAGQRRSGGTLDAAELGKRLGVGATEIEDDLGMLQQARIVARADDGGWVLARALRWARLVDLYRALKLPLAQSLGDGSRPWQERVAGAIQRISAAESQALDLPLVDLLGPDAPVMQRRRA